VRGSPLESRVNLNGNEIAVWEWPGAGRPVLFCHATGFHAHIWDRVIAHLAEYVPDVRCMAFDARGHGRSGKPSPPYAWPEFGGDVAALAHILGLRGAVGVGHSMGGHSVTVAAALQPAAFSALVLFDPVIHASEQYVGPWNRAAFVAKRRNHWNSVQQMYERFARHPMFGAWDQQVLRDYCEHALLPNGSGYLLACPPSVEVSIYTNNTAAASNINDILGCIPVPVHVIRAGGSRSGHIMEVSTTDPTLASRFPRGRDICLAGNTHFIPQESPELAAQLIAGALGEL
jgi:pimeloyl-ACP methyl ester carboxylesterase